MSDGPESIILRQLRRMDDKMDRLGEDMGDVKRRLSSLEMSISHLHGDFAGQSARMDRIETRLGRIERRLDLTDASA